MLNSVYQVKKAADPIDWPAAAVLSDFTYPWREEPPPSTVFRALWDEEDFHFRFEAAEDDLHTYADTNDKMEVVFSDRVEIFFRRDERMTPYYCLEMDAAGRVLDYRADYYRQFDYQWRWGEGLMVNAQMTPTGYRVTGRITLESLKKLGLLRKGQLEAGLFRANCVALEGKKADFKWVSWINPKMEKPDFHVPGAFGVLRLVDRL
jgi:hypothetical protein